MRYTHDDLAEFLRAVDALIHYPHNLVKDWDNGICYMLDMHGAYRAYELIADLNDYHDDLPDYGELTDQRANTLLLLSLLSVEELEEML